MKIIKYLIILFIVVLILVFCLNDDDDDIILEIDLMEVYNLVKEFSYMDYMVVLYFEKIFIFIGYNLFFIRIKDKFINIFIENVNFIWMFMMYMEIMMYFVLKLVFIVIEILFIYNGYIVF